MRKSLVLICVSALLLGTLAGCGVKKPADMPETFPFKVKIVDGSKPIADVQIQFLWENNAVVTGITGSDGVAQMQTTLQKYTAKGAPAGDFRVLCTKDPTVDHWKTNQERAEMSSGEAAAYMQEWQAKCDELPREIPKIWKDFDKTPLKTTVASGGGEVTFDVEGHAND